MRHPQMPWCPVLLFCLLVCALVPAYAQQGKQQETRPRTVINAPLVGAVELPPVLTQPRALARLVLPDLSGTLLPPSLPFNPFGNDPASVLRAAIMKRLGIRYRFYGTDDKGYDCSGFVWRVFKEAGIDFERVAARSLWQQLPEVSGDEIKQFGTLVFFNDLKHVGIVRDTETFYHASTSKGVTISNFAGYWEKRITGFRRVPLALLPDLLK